MVSTNTNRRGIGTRTFCLVIPCAKPPSRRGRHYVRMYPANPQHENIIISTQYDPKSGISIESLKIMPDRYCISGSYLVQRLLM